MKTLALVNFGFSLLLLCSALVIAAIAPQHFTLETFVGMWVAFIIGGGCLVAIIR